MSKKEEKSLGQSRSFFSDITPGDIEAIERKLYTEHELYNI